MSAATAARLPAPSSAPSAAPAPAAVPTTGRARRAASSPTSGSTPVARSGHTSAPLSTRPWQNGRGDVDLAASCAQRIRQSDGGRGFHVWVYQAGPDGKTAKVCSFCGYSEPRKVAAPQARTDVLVQQPVWVILDRQAAFDPERVVLLAGPFWDAATAIEANKGYTWSTVEPLRLRVTAASWRALARGGDGARDELLSLAGPGCRETVCAVSSADVDTGWSTPGFPVAP
jgi:hypothetical protein